MSDHPTMLPNRRHALAVMSASLGALCSPFVHAQAQTPYPARPVRMIVPTAAGSGSDLIARMLARQLTHRGQLFAARQGAVADQLRELLGNLQVQRGCVIGGHAAFCTGTLANRQYRNDPVRTVQMGWFTALY